MLFWEKSREINDILWGGSYLEKDHFKNSRFPAQKREISKFK